MNEYTKNEEGGSQSHVSVGGSLDEAFKPECGCAAHNKGLPGAGVKGGLGGWVRVMGH